ncbi:transcription-repair coupling factor [Fulvimonas yonginensis]|uniref:Transcription-repair-coupling factor n=1 Tax=Fulvimonas yonginensis TaxID=1495200 RepID=A0ABU8JFB8_9GAMM
MALHLPPPPRPASADTQCRWRPPHGAARALLPALAAQAHAGPVVVVAADAQEAWALEDELAFFAGPLPVLHFPDRETLPYDVFNPHPQIVAQRIATLCRLPALERGVLVVPAAALAHRLPPPSYVASAGFTLAVGQASPAAALRRRLAAAGYRRCAHIAEPGDYALRRGVLEIHPPEAERPLRIRLADETVASIRAFDPQTQRSGEALDELALPPAREYPLGADAAQRLQAGLADAGSSPSDAWLRELHEGEPPAGVECYLPLLLDDTATLFDYLPNGALFVLDPGVTAAVDAVWREARARHARQATDRPLPPPEALYLAPGDVEDRLASQRRVLFADDADAPASAPAPELGLAPAQRGAASLTRFLAGYAGAVLVAADSPGRRATLAEALAGAGLEAVAVEDWAGFLQQAGHGHRLALTTAPLEQGFALAEPALTVLTERELYGVRARRPLPRRHQPGPLAPGGGLADLREGDPVVHVESGIGRYRGLVSMELGGTRGEFLAIEYAEGDKLYVPVTQLGQVSRYAGTSPEHAPLHALGSGAWERTRDKAAADVRDAAAELLALQAAREARRRPPLEFDRTRLAAFAASFPYEETPDQRAAIDAVLADLAAPRPMDRVICGDVGFGKTEVALRAAFAVASAGRQVAVLVPTTLLAQQHHRSFAERLEGWPVTAAAISRFRSSRKLSDTLARLADGRLDVVIGTHKLLQPDVAFHDLGLVIIDEEQRFGVRQKEQLKKLRAQVDVLTMSATPIPRTLSMALGGLRGLSLIATPPTRRIAVRTTLTRWDDAVLREALCRELSRGGQAYFLHNAVESIETVAERLRALVPEARLAVAHGQMKAAVLARVMEDFYRRRANLLVCTTIIETGIDVPSANTIVIDRAESFGLAQLQQLRGRVGRSNRRAYAYLVISDPAAMTEEARQRLEAFAREEELGAGFALAAHDLEIRGAGELLGEAQSGQIQAVGFDLYARLLERTVGALQAGTEPDLELGRKDVEIELHLPASIPPEYVPDVPTRLDLYRRLAGATAAEAVDALQTELIERFGLLPEPAARLIAVARLRLMARALGIARLDLDRRGGVVSFGPAATIDGKALDRLLASQPQVYAREDDTHLAVKLELGSDEDVLRAAEELLARLGAPRPVADPAA